jgi:patatin-related protein
MNGGVSLAIWIGGVTNEIDCLRRASHTEAQEGEGSTTPCYRELLDCLREDVRVDVLSGASAGGINGALLAAAIACQTALPSLRDMWIDLGELGRLVRSSWESDPPSLLRGDEYALERLREVFAAVYAGACDLPSQQPIYLFLTTTDLSGMRQTFSDSMGREFVEFEHRIVFRFADDPDEEAMMLPSQRELDGAPPLPVGAFPFRVRLRDARTPELLALASRATSSFPVAFEPRLINLEDPREPEKIRPTYAVDGGVLDNQPFNPLLNQTSLFPADRPVRRIVGYVIPYVTDPMTLAVGGHSASEPDEGDPAPPSMRKTIGASSSLPRDLPRLDSLRRVRQEYRAAIEADQTRERLGPKILGGHLSPAARSLFETYRHTRHRAVFLRIRESLRADFEPGTGPSGGDETDDPRSLAPIARMDDPPLTDPGPPWLPVSGWDEARNWENDKLWSWGLTPAERVAGLALGFLRDALEQQLEKDDPDPELRRRLEGARVAAGTLVRDVRLMTGRFREALQELKSRDLSHDELLAAAEDLYRKSLGGELARLQELMKSLAQDLGACRAMLPERDRGECPLPTLKELLHAEVVLNAATGGAPVLGTPFDFLHMSAGVRNSLGHEAERPDQKLAGIKLGHFAGFLKRSWRANDWLWGRLDGVEHLMRALLDLGYVERFPKGSFTELQDGLAAFAFPGGDTDGVLRAAWAKTIRREGLASLEDDAKEPPDQLRCALAHAVELASEERKQPRRDRATRYLNCVRGALAARIQLEILKDDLRPVAHAVLADREAGASKAAVGNTWAKDFLATKGGDQLRPEEAVDRFHELHIASEDPLDELGAPLGIGLVSRIVPVGTAALAGDRSGLPARIRAPLATLRGLTFVLGGLGRLAARAGRWLSNRGRQKRRPAAGAADAEG